MARGVPAEECRSANGVLTDMSQSENTLAKSSVFNDRHYQ
jgi:hypothetical protein